MKNTVSDYLLRRMGEWGIKRIYGYPGDGINGIMGALDRAEKDMEFIQVRHEEMAAFMACAHAKFTGEVGVCMATSGPGAIHLLNGLYDAKKDSQPVVAIVGQQSRMAIGSDYQQEIDLMSLFKDVAGEYVQMVTQPAQLRQVVDRAFRIAKVQRTVTCIIIPNDLQEEKAEEAPPRQHSSVFTGVGHANLHVVPHAADLQKAADVLNAGKKVAMLIGAGAIGAHEEVEQVAERLGAGVAKALLGKAALSDYSPYTTGGIGLLGTEPSWYMMQECDTLLMVGSSFPYSEFLPKEGKARGVQIDIDGRRLSMRYPMEVNLIGGSKETLQALLLLLTQKEDGSWLKKLQGKMKEWEEVIEARAMNEANPINPQRIFSELSKRLPDDCIITADSGTVANWFGRNLKVKETMKATLSGNLATMIPGVPYAIAAKFAFPNRIPIALMGDGAMQMLGINELITISKYWKEWSDPRLIIMVLNNGDLNQVTWEQRIMQGNPKFEGSQNLPDFPYAKYAELLGLKGIYVDKPEDIGAAWDAALSADRPCLLDIKADPDVPIIPPHITFDQAKKYTTTLLKGDPDEGGIIKQTFKDVMEAILPHKEEK